MGILRKYRKKFQKTNKWQLARTYLPRVIFETLCRKPRDVFFIWIPKCAGTSIYRTLVENGCFERRWETPEASFVNRGIITFGHVGPRDLLANHIVSRKYAQDAFKFAFVRNPYDRLVSLFFHLKKIKSQEVPEEMPFPAFCEKVCRGDIPPVGFYNYRGLNQCNPMVDWILDDNGAVLPKFIGRFESLQEDFKKVCDIIGIESQLPHANPAREKHEPYPSFYNTTTKALVRKFYEKDLDMFKYTFRA